MPRPRPIAAIRAFVSRRRWWILGVAAIVKTIELAVPGGFSVLGGLGDGLGGVSTLILVVGGFLLLRWMIRRYLFSVSRRLGLAFVFVGVIPLLLLALLSVAIMGMGVVSLASHEARQELDHAVDETAAAAVLAEDRLRSTPIPPGWREDVEDGVHVLAWVAPTPDPMAPDAPGADTRRGPDAPPDWLLDGPFEGVVANASMPYVLGSRTGTLDDGHRYLVLVAVPFDDVSRDMAATLGVDLAMRPSSMLRLRARQAWPRLPDRPVGAVVQGDEGGRGDDPLDAVARALEEGGDDLPGIDGEADSTASLSLQFGFSSGERRVPASALLDIAVIDLGSGESLGDGNGGLDGLPLVQLDFSTVDFVADRVTGGQVESFLWQGIQILSITLGVMVLVAIAIGVGLTSSVTRAVNALHRGTERIGAGALDHRIQVRSRDQLGAMADSFNQMTASVTGLLRERADHERLEHEMAIAADVQHNMLPEGFPTIPGLEGAARCIMAKQVGGDLYDFIPIGPDRLGILLGDVSGKGVSAALVMSNVVSAARSLLSGSDTPGPAALLTRLNGILHRTTSPETFVTLFYAEYDLRTGNLRYANAGHDWPFVITSDGEMQIELEASGLMLGALGDSEVSERELALRPGQILVAYSDGLVDTVNAADEPFELRRVHEAIRPHLGESPARIVDAIVERLRAFRGDAEEIDDVTLVVLRRVSRPGDPDPDPGAEA